MTISWLVAIGAFGMLALATGIILFVVLYQRRVINHQIQLREFNRQKELELMQASIRSEEDERMRIASELHDDVGATLSSIRLFLTQAARKPGDASLIIQSQELLDASIQKIRDISHQLQPGALQYLGLARALQSYTETLSRSGALRVDFHMEATAWQEPQAQPALAIYRIIQELVNNTIRHSGATRIRIALHQDEERQSISIIHDGSGLSEAGYQEQLLKKGAIGLKNIETRIKSSNLSLVFPEPEADIYCIRICLPAADP